MAVREKFEGELLELSNKILKLGEYAGEALNNSFNAFKMQDNETALSVLEFDQKVNLLEEEINDVAMLLIAKQQPVAIDLRRIMVAIKIAADLERMADYGVNIAKATIRIGKCSTDFKLDDLEKMHTLMIKMLGIAMDAYSNEDVYQAQKIAVLDDQVDELNTNFIKDMFECSNMGIQEFNHYSFISRNIERAADHITNIAENIYFVVKGKHLDLNK